MLDAQVPHMHTAPTHSKLWAVALFAAASTMAIDALADSERVQLADGSIYEGELVEKVPNDHITLKLATGEIRRIEWSALAPQTQASPPLVPPTVAPMAGATESAHVSVGSDRPGPILMKNPGYGATFTNTQGPATLSVVTSDENPVPVCYAPCSADVDPRATYYVTGAYISRTRSFAIPSGNSTLHISPGSSVISALGGWSLGLGILSMIVGGIELPVSFIDANTSAGLNGWQYAGIGTLIAGASLCLLAIPLLLAGNTHATINGIDVARDKARFTPLGFTF